MPFGKFRAVPTIGLAAAALVTFALSFAACSGSSKTAPADKWVTTICDAAASFQKVSNAQGENLAKVDFKDGPAAKKAFEAALDETAKASKTLRSEFDKAGKPDLKSGADVFKAFEGQFKENDQRAADLKKKVAAIDAKGDVSAQLEKLFSEVPDIDFRPKLEAVAQKQSDAQAVIDGIDANSECASVYFSADKGSNSPPSGGAVTTSAPPKTVNEKWVAGICTSFAGWVKEIDNANTKLQASLGKFDASKDSAKDLKQKLVDFLKTGQTETKNLKKEIDALKTPDVKDGAAIHGVFAKAGTDLVKIFDGAVADAEKINASTFISVANDIEGFETKITSSFDAVSSAFDQLDKFSAPELEKVFSSRSECADLR
ncbi:MAG: hypothetical protein ABI939_01650 [Anaerolineaceae bacterium]